jgi:hypothetical protein
VSADDLQTIATYINNIEAELAHSALEAAGIDAMIRADDCGGTRPHMWMGGVQLIVREEDVERAREVLDNEPRPLEPQEFPLEP